MRNKVSCINKLAVIQKYDTMKKNFTLTFFLLTIITWGQDTIYYDYDWNKVSSFKYTTYYQIVQHDKADTNRVTEKIYFKSGQIKTEKSYAVYKDRKLDGKLKEWYESGQLRKDIDYKSGKLNGRLLTYWDNGKPKRIDRYENDKLIEGKCMNFDGIATIHYDYEKRPEFPGGTNELMQHLVKELKYPNKSRKEEIEGRVLVGFIVNKNGTISDIKIIQSVNKQLDEEAIRVVKKMPKWEPGMQDGEAVRVTFNLPIEYQLN